MDTRLLLWINSHHNSFFDALLWWASAATDLYCAWWLLGIAAWRGDRKQGRRVLLSVAVALALAYVSVDLILKPLAARPRPFDALAGVRTLELSWLGELVPSRFSFPSGHCASSAAAAVVFGSFYRRARLPLAIIVGLVAYSRVYLGMHYPSDCLAGFAIGTACGICGLRVARRVPETADNSRSTINIIHPPDAEGDPSGGEMPRCKAPVRARGDVS